MSRSSNSGTGGGKFSSTTSFHHSGYVRAELTLEARNRQRERLAWFKSEHGTYLRTIIKNHVHQRTPKETKCALCNINNQRNIGSKKTNIKCRTCDVQGVKKPLLFKWRLLLLNMIFLGNFLIEIGKT